MSYYVPHEKVFVNNRRRSTSLNPIKTNNFLELNRNLWYQNYRGNTLQAIKHDSNYLLGSSIVNVNFVNNVSNPNRGYEGCRNIPIINNPLYQRGNIENDKYESPIKSNFPIKNGLNSYENSLPFENYNYHRSTSESHIPGNKNLLNIEDKIIRNSSYKTPEWPSVSETRNNSGPILTKNYIAISPAKLINSPQNEKKISPKLSDPVTNDKNGHDLKSLGRKKKLGEYLDKLNNTTDKTDNSIKKVKITIGKPTHEFFAKYPDPIEKELEKWHNSHNSTLKWERVKHGLYSVGGSVVHLLKLNGSLYVEGHGFKKYKGKMTILRFVEEKESKLINDKT